MALSDLTDRNAVLAAIAEVDAIGQEAFLRKYGFREARKFVLIHEGRFYDSKAIAGAAYQYQYPDRGSLTSQGFSGGVKTVAPRLKSLGFVVSGRGETPKEILIWLFKAKPSIYRIQEAVLNLDLDLWTTGGSDVRHGDHAVIWQTLDREGRRGIVGLGEVVGDPVFQSDVENPYWINSADGQEAAFRAPVRYLEANELPLWIGNKATDTLLLGLSVARAHGGTVFNIEPDQWKAILELAGDPHLPSQEEVQVLEQVRYRSQRSRGQGFGLTQDERRAVEMHAMALAKAHYEERGWDAVQDVSATASFDLLCRSPGRELRVEVKGTTSEGTKVILTRNEVKQADRPGYALFVVSDIKLEHRGSPDVRVSSGRSTVFEPFSLEHHKLDPIAYDCELNATRGQPLRTFLLEE